MRGSLFGAGRRHVLSSVSLLALLGSPALAQTVVTGPLTVDSAVTGTYQVNANGDLDTGFGNPATPGYQGLNLADAPLTPSALILDGAARYLLGGVSERAGMRRNAPHLPGAADGQRCA